MSEPIEGQLIERPAGRPTKYGEEIVKKLEHAFHWAFNITEACQYADITKPTYYAWLADDDVFSYRMSVAQAAPNKSAKSIVVKAIQANDPNLALRFLMLRDPDFKPKAELVTPPEVEETRKLMREALDAIAQHDPSSEPPAPDQPDDRGVVADAPTDIS